MKDYYEILGVEKSATQNDIKKAYRKVAMKYHPDKNHGDQAAETKFKEAADAYSILSDEDKRSRYDQFGHAGVSGNGQGHTGFTDINDIFSNFGDIFETMGMGGFGDIFGGGSRQRRSRGSDLKLTLPVSLEEILTGNEKTVKIKRFESCQDCSGSGSSSGSHPETCEICNGVGEVRQVQKSFLGQVVKVQPCYNCNGAGKVILTPCKTCKGDGRLKMQSSITIEIPVGVISGNYMTKRGSGNIGPQGSQSGNLIIIFEEIEHNLFTRNGNDILVDALVDFSISVFGGSIEVPTLKGKVKLKIPSGIKSGQVLRLRGKGIPELNSHRIGDLLVRININTPQKLNKQAKESLKKFTSECFLDEDFKKYKI